MKFIELKEEELKLVNGGKGDVRRAIAYAIGYLFGNLKRAIEDANDITKSPTLGTNANHYY